MTYNILSFYRYSPHIAHKIDLLHIFLNQFIHCFPFTQDFVFVYRAVYILYVEKGLYKEAKQYSNHHFMADYVV